jgi:hypothetical protein
VHGSWLFFASSEIRRSSNSSFDEYHIHQLLNLMNMALRDAIGERVGELRSCAVARHSG